MRIFLRVGVLPLLAILVIWDSATDPIPLARFLLLFLSAFLVVPLVMLSYWRIEGDPPTGVMPRWARVAAPIVWTLSVAVIGSVIVAEWPFRVSFHANKPKFERMVALSRQDKPVRVPQKVGPFRVTEVDTDWEGTLIYLNDAGSGQGPMLFVSAPKYARKHRDEHEENRENVALGDDWYLLSPFD